MLIDMDDEQDPFRATNITIIIISMPQTAMRGTYS
jgi:hypothetical protein